VVDLRKKRVDNLLNRLISKIRWLLSLAYYRIVTYIKHDQPVQTCRSATVSIPVIIIIIIIVIIKFI